jgi:hypothetical protein
VCGRRVPAQDRGILANGSHTLILLMALVVIAASIVLAVLVADTLRAARRMGGLAPFTPTYRAYGA